MTKRGQIVAEVLNALQAISTDGGEFETNLGSVIEVWTGIPFKIEDGALVAELRDVREEQDERVSGWHNRHLTMEVLVGTANGVDGIETIRSAIGDVEWCLGEYRKSGGAGLIHTLQLQSNDVSVEQKDRIVAMGRVTFRVTYRTQSFSPDA